MVDHMEPGPWMDMLTILTMLTMVDDINIVNNEISMIWLTIDYHVRPWMTILTMLHMDDHVDQEHD